MLLQCSRSNWIFSHVLNTFIFLSICQVNLYTVYYGLLDHTVTPKLDYGILKHYMKDAIQLLVRVWHEIGKVWEL